jgi:hypothetical protein
MIIRPACKKEYVALPNSLFNDRRLSADTRAMIALLLSKPRGWELRPPALAKLLSREGGTRVGRTRLYRMFAEATAAGYMARSAKQNQNDDGTWGKYTYFVGMPEDLARAVKKAGIAIAPQSRDPHEGKPRAADEPANIKEQIRESTDSRNSNYHQHQHLLLGQAAKRRPTEEAKPKPRINREGPEVVQHRLALRLGRGDVAKGWLIFGALPNARRDALTAMERIGTLAEDELSAVRASVCLSGAQPAGSAPRNVLR